MTYDLYAAYTHYSHGWVFFFHIGGVDTVPQSKYRGRRTTCKSPLSFHHVDPEGRTQGVSLGRKALTHEAISPTMQFLYSRWRTNVGQSHKHPNIHIAAIKTGLWTLHIETHYTYYLPWNFILQLSAAWTENKGCVYQAIAKRLEKLVIDAAVQNLGGQEKDGITHGLCHLPGVVLNLNLKALAFSL